MGQYTIQHEGMVLYRFTSYNWNLRWEIAAFIILGRSTVCNFDSVQEKTSLTELNPVDVS